MDTRLDFSPEEGGEEGEEGEGGEEEGGEEGEGEGRDFIDTRGPGRTGNVWLREEIGEELLEKAGKEVREAYIQHSDFRPTWLFITTWDSVGYYNRRTDKVTPSDKVTSPSNGIPPVFSWSLVPIV